MARSLVFTNANNETITLERSPYLITDIDGLGVPPVDVQEQQSPFIDGTVAIDTVLAPREITVTVSIIAPNDFTNIDTYRRDIVKKLNPKLGPGTIVYTTEGGTSYRIIGVPSSVVFRPKEYNTPYAEAQIVFHCHDPYWQKTTETTVDIKRIFDTTETVINSALSYSPIVFNNNNNVLYMVYYSGSNKISFRTSADSGVTWAAAIEIVTDCSSDAYIDCIQLQDNSYIISYTRNSDNYLVIRTSSNFTSWSTAVEVEPSTSESHSMIQALNKNILIAYRKQSDTYIKLRISDDFGATWGSSSNAVAANSSDPLLYQRDDGYVFLYYSKQPSLHLAYKYATAVGGALSSETVLVSDDVTKHIIVKSNSIYRLFYSDVTSGNLVQRISKDLISWGQPTNEVFSFGTSYRDIILIGQSDYYLFYTKTTTYYVALKKGNQTIINNVSDFDSPCVIVFNGPSSTPRIENLTTDEYIQIISSSFLDSGDYFTVNTQNGQKSVIAVVGGVSSNAIKDLDISSTFFNLVPGINALCFSDVYATSTATVTYRERYAGI